MAKKAIKKVDFKKVEKVSIMKVVSEALRSAGYAVEDGEDFGFTSGTVVVKGEKCDIQLKPISPKAGLERYEALEEEEEEVEEETPVEEAEVEAEVE